MIEDILTGKIERNGCVNGAGKSVSDIQILIDNTFFYFPIITHK